MIDNKAQVKVAPASKREVKAKWLDMHLARKNFDYVSAIFGQKLPKVQYSKRVNGKKKRLNNTSIRNGSKKDRSISRTASPVSKHMEFFRHYMQAGMILQGAERAFSDILQEQEKKKGGSIKQLIADSQAKPAAA